MMRVEENSAKSGNEIIKLTVTDTSHLIDLPAQDKIFSKKIEGGAVTHPKATIRILTFPYPKNGLSNLL